VDGKWAYVYSTRGDTARVAMSRLAKGQARASLYNPRDGTWYADGGEDGTQRPFETGIASGAGAPDYYFYPPGRPADGNDWVLVVEV